MKICISYKLYIEFFHFIFRMSFIKLLVAYVLRVWLNLSFKSNLNVFDFYSFIFANNYLKVELV